MTIRFEKENIDLEIKKKNFGSIEIPMIKIENVGNKTYDKLFLVKNENESNPYINFIDNSKNIKIHKLSLNGDFTPNKEESHLFNLGISNPNSCKIYTLWAYIRENENGINLSKAFKINVKIKEEPKEVQKEKAKKLFEQLKNQYEYKYNLAILCSKEDLLKKIIEINYNIQFIKELIETEFDKKAGELFKELKMEDILTEEEGKEKIIEFKFNKEKLNESG